MDLLQNIVHCENVHLSLSNPHIKHPCAHNLNVYGCVSNEDFSVPEPWSGDIENAIILFICASPIHNQNEVYPKYSWSDYIISDFFNNRFGGGLRQWVRNHLHPLLEDGNHTKEWSRYWAEVRKRTKELLLKKDIIGGKDYAIYPLVHCKIEEKHMNQEIITECINKFFLQMLNISNAKIVVCLGKDTGAMVRNILQIPHDINPYGPHEIGKCKRYILCAQHPYARRVPHSLKKLLSPQALEEMHSFLHNT